MISFACPECDRSSTVTDGFVGQEGKCPGCFTYLRVPDPDAPPDPDDAGPPAWGRAPQRVDPPAPPAPADGPPCPECGEPLRPSAKKCRYCGLFLRGGRPSWTTGWVADDLGRARQRLVAGTIDLALVAVGVAVAYVITLVIDPPAHDVEPIAFAFAGAFTLGIHGLQSWLLVKDGATIGMRACELRLRRMDGGRATFGAAVVKRSWMFWCLLAVSAMTGFLAPALLLCELVLLISPGRMTLRDSLSGTVVAQERALG